jgi:hypothetical protein
MFDILRGLLLKYSGAEFNASFGYDGGVDSNANDISLSSCIHII